MVCDVFISYCPPDAVCAFELVADLERRCVDCLIAPRDLPPQGMAPSVAGPPALIDAVPDAGAMILLFSAHTNQSADAQREVARAVQKRLSILTFRIENVLPCKNLEYYLRASHSMDAFPPPRAPYYARLSKYLKLQRGAKPQRGARPKAGNLVNSAG
jgi:hypothetical protein